MRNEKGEDWGKYLNEMQELQPLLRQEMGQGQGLVAKNDYKPIQGKDGAPINDPTVKKREKKEIFDKNGKVLDKKGKEEKFAIVNQGGAILSSTHTKRQKKAQYVKENADKIAAFMQQEINAWVEGVMKKLFTSTEMRALQEGEKWPIRRHKVKIDIQHLKEPGPVGTDIVTVIKKKKAIAQQKFVWEV